MKTETIIQLIREKITDEEDLTPDYYTGRVEAFRFCLELLTEEPGEWDDDQAQHDMGLVRDENDDWIEGSSVL